MPYLQFQTSSQQKLYGPKLILLLALLDDLLILPVVGRLPSPAATPHCEGAPLLALLDGMLLRPIVIRLSLPSMNKCEQAL